MTTMSGIDRDTDIPNWLLMALAVVAAGALSAVGVARYRARPVWLGTIPAAHASNWRQFDDGRLVLGSSRAPYTLVVFSDYECPACRILERSVDTLMTAYPDSFRVVYRHVVNPAHPHSAAAAMAAECAAEQGRFGAMHHALFGEAHLADTLWVPLARRAGVPDTARFRACLAGSGRARAALARDAEAGRTANVTGTPVVLANGLRVFGAVTTSALQDIVHHP